MSTLATRELEQHEEVIDRGIQTFMEVGTALAIIQQQKLYKTAGYKSFRTYLAERYPQIGPRHGYYLIAAAAVTDELRKVCTRVHTLPETERVARPLVDLQGEPEKLREAWEMAVTSAGEKQPTAAQVKEAVAEVRDRDWLRTQASALSEMKALSDRLKSDAEAYRPASDFALFHEDYAKRASTRALPPAALPVSAKAIERLAEAADQYENTARTIRAWIKGVDCD